MSETAMLTVDAGCSGTKVILRQRASTPKLLIMSPEVIEVTRESIDFYLSKNGITVSAPENEAWVEYDGTIYAVGFLAQEYFKARVALKDTKYEWAIAKVLAAVGVMVAREGIEGECDFAISIPLPYGEWEVRHEFERDLRSALSCFSFRQAVESEVSDVHLCPRRRGTRDDARRKDGIRVQARKDPVIDVGVSRYFISVIQSRCNQRHYRTFRLLPIN